MKIFYSLPMTVKSSGTQKIHLYQEMKSWKYGSQGKVSHPFHRVSNDSDLGRCQISLIISNNNVEQCFTPCQGAVITDQNLENPSKADQDFSGTKVEKISTASSEKSEEGKGIYGECPA